LNAGFAEVAVFSALYRTLHYQVPPDLRGRLQPGARILVPLRRRESLGLVLNLVERPPELHKSVEFRTVTEIVDLSPVVRPDLLALCRWASRYYFYPLGEVIKAALPAGLARAPRVRYRLVEHGEREEDASALVRFLAGARERSLEEIADFAGDRRSDVLGEIRRLCGEGRAERRLIWPAAGSSAPKRVKMVELNTGEETEAVGAAAGEANRNALQLLEFVRRSGGRVPMRELRAHVSNLDYWVRKLQKSNVVTVGEVEESRESPFAQNVPELPPHELTGEQRKVFDEVVPSIRNPEFRPVLLEGVTSSGKTEVYLHLVREVLAVGRGALVLVPEIALSTQLEALFRQRFGDRLAVWHSGLSPGARYDQWRRIVKGERPVVLGVRSAIFSPLPDAGLIVVDEEHDASYKQEDRLRYHARDAAVMRAKLLGIPVVLGSATPSLQSVHNASQGRYRVSSLPKRVHERPFPELKIVDMRRQRGSSRILSPTLRTSLRETLDKGRQALLFLNRRGFSTFLLCHRCGQVLQCTQCAVSLTYHQKEHLLRCHYCGLEREPSAECPVCGQPSLIQYGCGTERVEEEVRKILPESRVMRIDRDTVSHAQYVVEMLNAMREGSADVLIGTQMVAKGHDFPNITLVGVINADVALQAADYRGGETTVQLLTQVAGRAGRGEEPGEVILQTYNPEHYTIQSVSELDYRRFCERELESREALQYPPYSRMVRYLVTASTAARARDGAFRLAELARVEAARFRGEERPVALVGPAPAPLSRLKNRYRYHLFIKAWTNRDLQDFTEAVLERAEEIPSLRRDRLIVDRDPIHSL
jgi:primosomal protein N' (replication factor Y)